MPQARFENKMNELRYREMLQLRRGNLITAQQYATEVAKITKKDKTFVQKREAREQAKEDAFQEQLRLKRIADEKKAEEQRKANALKRKQTSLKRKYFNYSILSLKSLRNYDNLESWALKIPGKQYTIEAYFNGVRFEVSKNDSLTNEDWWSVAHYRFFVDSEQYIYSKGIALASLLNSVQVIPFVGVKGKKKIQKLREGTVHCIFHPIKQFFVKKQEETTAFNTKKQLYTYIKRCDELAKKYDNGVSVSELEVELKTLNMTVYMVRIDRCHTDVINPKAKWSFSFINSQMNHAEVYLADSNEIQVNEVEMKKIYNEHMESKKEFSYESSGDNVRTIEAVGKKYKLKPTYTDMFNAFSKQINREWLNVDMVKEPELFRYIQSSYFHNTHMSFQEIHSESGLKEIDCKAGYTQYKQAPIYKGFLGNVYDWVQSPSLHDVYKNIGIYTILIVKSSAFYTKVGFEVGKEYTLTSPMIEFLTTKRFHTQSIDLDITNRQINVIECVPLYGIYGKQIDITFPTEFMNKYDSNTGKIYTYGDKDAKGIPLYTLWTGQTASCNTHRVIKRRIAYEMVQDLKHQEVDIEWQYDNECYNLTLDEQGNYIRSLKEEYVNSVSPPGCSVQYVEKKMSMNCPQIYSFITDYMRMNMLYELQKIPLDDIYAWKVDSIIYKPSNLIQSFRPMFREKEMKANFAMSSSIFKQCNITNPFYYKDKGYIHSNTLFAGAGGSGKSHFASKMRNLIYVAPMWSMNVDFHSKYNIKSLTPHQILGLDGARKYFDTTFYRPSTVFVDEATMLSNDVKIALQKELVNCRLIFGGDFDIQNRPFQTIFTQGSAFKANDLHRYEFNHDYRSMPNDPLIEIKQKIRQFMSEKYGDSLALLEYVKTLIPTHKSNKDVYDLYELEDWILTGTHQHVNEWTSALEEKGQKYLVNKHSMQDVYKAFNGEDVALNGQIIFHDNMRCDFRHAFTIHSAQGKTIKSKIFIDCRSVLFDYCLLYTAISRATSLSQLYLIY